MNFWKIIVAFVLAFFIVVAGLVCFLTFTERGSRRVADYAFEKWVDTDTKNFQEVTGNLLEGISFKNVELADLAWMPAGSVLRIQRVDVWFPSFDVKNIKVIIENGRLTLPASEPVVFTALYEKGQLSLNVFSKSVEILDVVRFLDNPGLYRTSGRISDIDVYARGPLDQLQLDGKFSVDRMSNSTFTLTESPGTLAMTCDVLKLREEKRVDGNIVLEQGTLTIRNVSLQLEKSKILFSRESPQPFLHIRGTTTIDQFKITLALTGRKGETELELTSIPPKPRDELLVMLGTGKSWQGVDEHNLAPQLASEILDFFLLSRVDEGLGEKVGTIQATVTYDENTKGIGVKKRIGDNLKIGYEINQSQTTQQGEPANVKHKLEGEIRVTPNISIEGEKELQPQQTTTADTVNTPPKADDKVFLKFKKNF